MRLGFFSAESQPLRRRGVELIQQGEQRIYPFRLKLFSESARVVLVAHPVAETDIVQQGIDIQSRAAHDEGQLSPADDLLNAALGVLHEHRDGVGFVGREEIHQVMRDTALLCLVGLCGRDGHALIDLHGVGGDDLAVKMLGERHRNLCFPGSGRSHKGNDPDGVVQLITSCRIVFRSHFFS